MFTNLLRFCLHHLQLENILLPNNLVFEQELKKKFSSVHFLYKLKFTHNILSIFFNWPSIIKIITKILWVLVFLILEVFTFHLIPILLNFNLSLNLIFVLFYFSTIFIQNIEILVKGKKIIFDFWIFNFWILWFFWFVNFWFFGF